MFTFFSDVPHLSVSLLLSWLWFFFEAFSWWISVEEMWSFGFFIYWHVTQTYWLREGWIFPHKICQCGFFSKIRCVILATLTLFTTGSLTLRSCFFKLHFHMFCKEPIERFLLVSLTTHCMELVTSTLIHTLITPSWFHFPLLHIAAYIHYQQTALRTSPSLIHTTVSRSSVLMFSLTKPKP